MADDATSYVQSTRAYVRMALADKGRDAMNFPGHEQIISLNLGITTYCSRCCTECCCSINKIENKEHSTIDEIFHIVKTVNTRGVVVTGGEPMLHPDIALILRELRVLNKFVAIATNASFGREKLQALNYANQIQVSKYDDLNVPDSLNVQDVSALLDYVDAIQFNRPQVIINHPEHKAHYPHGAHKCPRGKSGLISSAYGLLYGCCVAPGIPGAIGVAPIGDWQSCLMHTELPCFNCRFGLGDSVVDTDAIFPWDRANHKFVIPASQPMDLPESPYCAVPTVAAIAPNVPTFFNPPIATVDSRHMSTFVNVTNHVISGVLPNGQRICIQPGQTVVGSWFGGKQGLRKRKG